MTTSRSGLRRLGLLCASCRSALSWTCLSVSMAACGSGDSPSAGGPYSIGGTITWADETPTGLVLGTSGQPDLLINPGQTSFRFADQVASGSAYDVTVVTHPIKGGCLVTNGSGTVAHEDVTSISVACDGRLVSGDLNVARAFYFIAVALPNDQVLVAGGHTPGPEYPVTDTAELFDPRTGKWTMAASMTAPRASACAVLLPSGKVLVAGGIAGGNKEVGNSAEIYDPALDTWTAVADLMADSHDLPACVSLDSGKVLIIGGLKPGNQSTAVAEIFDPDTGTFSTTGSMALARYWHTATVLRPEAGNAPWAGKVLVAGGCTGGYPCTSTTSSAELYDPDSGTWSATGDLPEGVFGHTATFFSWVPDMGQPSSGVLVTGGCRSDALCGPESDHTGSAEDTASVYDPTSGEFAEPGGRMSTGRVGHVAILDEQLGIRLIGGTYDAVGSRTTDVCSLRDGPGQGWERGTPTVVDHGSYLQAVRTGSYWLVIGGLGPWSAGYLLTAAVEGAWE